MATHPVLEIPPSPEFPPIRWRRALASLRALIADSDDTAKAIDLFYAIGNRNYERSFLRFAASATGRQLLAERPSLGAALADRAALARLPDGTLVGGAVGRTWGSCCELLQLWVDAAHRGRGIATQLVQAFEARAAARGCRIYYLTTLSFQAPGLYQRLGYDVLAQIDGYPEGIVKYLMHKVVA
jgi:GNAT superfamily N-acetyltransferase